MRKNWKDIKKTNSNPIYLMADLNTNYSVDSFVILAAGDSNSVTSGSLVTNGGLGVVKSAHVGEHHHWI